MRTTEQYFAIATLPREQLKLASIPDGTLDVPKSGEADVLATAKSLSSLLSVQSLTFTPPNATSPTACWKGPIPPADCPPKNCSR